MLKPARDGKQAKFKYIAMVVRIRADFLETVQARRQWCDIFKIVKEEIFF